jgi:hypothetical protein
MTDPIQSAIDGLQHWYRLAIQSDKQSVSWVEDNIKVIRKALQTSSPDAGDEDIERDIRHVFGFIGCEAMTSEDLRGAMEAMNRVSDAALKSGDKGRDYADLAIKRGHELIASNSRAINTIYGLQESLKHPPFHLEQTATTYFHNVITEALKTLSPSSPPTSEGV